MTFQDEIPWICFVISFDCSRQLFFQLSISEIKQLNYSTRYLLYVQLLALAFKTTIFSNFSFQIIQKILLFFLPTQTISSFSPLEVSCSSPSDLGQTYLTQTCQQPFSLIEVYQFKLTWTFDSKQYQNKIQIFIWIQELWH